MLVEENNRLIISELDCFSDNLKGRSKKEGLYDPKNEHDACGLGFIANIKGKKSHKIISDGLYILENLEHRGATGADPLVGDGAGMLTQIPHDFFSIICKNDKIEIPEEGEYGVGFFFFPREICQHESIKLKITLFIPNMVLVKLPNSKR